jgi:uncharacterized protein YlxW (UPF0749 family)
MSDTERPDEPTPRTTPPIVPPGDRPAPEPVTGEQPLPGMPADPSEPDLPATGDGELPAAGQDDLPDEADAAKDGGTKAARTPGRAWQRIRDGLKPSRGQAIVGAVLGLVAFLAVVQVRLNLADDGYANARREDLIAILDGLGQSTRRLESEIAELQQRKNALSSGADRAENARAQAEEQIRVLGILAGTLPAQGPGVRITMTDPDGKVESSNLLDAIQELRDAGAEAIQINGKARVVASTAFVDDPPGVRVDGTRVEPPYVIEAIGDSHNLSEAANFPGGLVSEIEGPQINGAAEVVMLPHLQITALHTPQEHRYARPAASPTR